MKLKWFILRFFLDRIFPVREPEQKIEKRPDEVLPPLPEKAAKIGDVCAPPRESGKKFRPRQRNRIFKYRSNIRAAMQELRDEGAILGYSEEPKPNSLVYRIFIRQGRKPLSLHFLTPRPREERKRGIEAFHEQIFIQRYPAVGFLKALIQRRIEARTKGWDNEERLLRLLNELRGELPMSGHHLRIENVRFATECEDKEGKIDVIVRLELDSKIQEMGLQCKSSVAARDAHKAANPGVPSIFVGNGRTDEKLKHKLIYIMYRFMSGEIASR